MIHFNVVTPPGLLVKSVLFKTANNEIKRYVAINGEFTYFDAPNNVQATGFVIGYNAAHENVGVLEAINYDTDIPYPHNIMSVQSIDENRVSVNYEFWALNVTDRVYLPDCLVWFAEVIQYVDTGITNI